MKKRIVSILLISALLTPAFCGSASAADNGQPQSKVEISFKVGDSILNINGTDVTVETPYVAGEGTTLVPLRVITEAFGAEVTWDETDQKITLTYPDVEIVLQIGNKTAQVNSFIQTLDEAPVLSENGVTMVPLRFISETFGAEVEYDNASQAILVTKETQQDDGPTIGITDMKKIGDSYLKWSLDTPKNLTMLDRRFDGMQTVFSDQDDNLLVISINTVDEDTSFDEVFIKVKESLKNYTLLKADKRTDPLGNPYMHFQSKSKEEFLDLRIYFKDGLLYETSCVLDVEADSSVREQFTSLLDTFTLQFDQDEVHDLSNVAEGHRVFSDDKYKVSLKIPANWIQYTSSSKNVENEFTFYPLSRKDYVSRIFLGIYSKTDAVNAKTLAEADRENTVAVYGKLSSCTEVSPTRIAGGSGYRYSQTLAGSKHDFVKTDVFFDVGDYVYNIAIALPAPLDEKALDTILLSVEAELLDAQEIGSLLRNDLDDTTLLPIETDLWSLERPSTWKTVGTPTGTSTIFLDTKTESSAIIQASSVMDNSVSLEDLKRYVKEELAQQKKNLNADVAESVSMVDINDSTFLKYALKVEDKDAVLYHTIYTLQKNKRIYRFILVEREEFYGGQSSKIFEEMLKSFQLLK
jgi:hypothetical protein